MIKLLFLINTYEWWGSMWKAILTYTNLYTDEWRMNEVSMTMLMKKCLLKGYSQLYINEWV